MKSGKLAAFIAFLLTQVLFLPCIAAQQKPTPASGAGTHAETRLALREGWTLHIVLDTSGSMANVLPKVLGAIASFCDGAGVSQIHILQCDIEVTRDEWLEPAQLAEYRIAGFGGSDMSPGLLQLVEDTEVSAVLVLTDGYIDYPAAEPPYRVLWAVFRSPDGYDSTFRPAYGEVIFLDP